MKIKPATQLSFLNNILFLLGILGVLVLSFFLINKYDKIIDESSVPATIPVSFLKKESSLLEVLNHFNDHTIFLSVNDEASAKMSATLRSELIKIGGDTLANIGMRQSYTGLLRNGVFTKETIQDSLPTSIKRERAEIHSAGNYAGNYSYLLLDAIKHPAESRGLNLFVVNKLNQLVGLWNFDFYAQEFPLSSAKNGQGTSSIQTIEIVIKSKHYDKLKAKRKEALTNKILISSDGDLVPANLFFKDESYKVRMRLKGDWTDHLKGDQWSFRVKLNKDDAILGMHKFSLHRPQTRNYAGEWLYHQMLADAGIMNLQYHFVMVVLKIEDGLNFKVKNLGLYALEESFDKQVIERNQRREGIIMKLDENLLWKERAAFINGKLNISDLQFFNFSPYEQMNVIPFSVKRVVSDSTLFKHFLTGSSLFRDFINRKKLPSEVYNVPLLAKYQAITNLLGANHAMAAHNYRVYYNPVTSKLEPIGFDGNAGRKSYYFQDYFGSENDVIYKKAYVKAVEEITSDEFMEKLINWPGFKEIVILIKNHFPEYEWLENTLIHNQKTLMKKINPIQSLRVNFVDIKNGNFNVSIDNFSRFPVEIHSLIYKGKRSFTTLTEPLILPHSSRTTVAFPLDHNYNNLFTNKKKKKAGFSFKEDILKIQIQYNILGSSQLRTEKVLPWNNELNKHAYDDPFQKVPNAHEFDFLIFDEKAKTITCMAGFWQLQKPLTIPPGYIFVVGPGCRLELTSRFISIFSFSPIHFIGTPTNPVEIFSDTNNGGGLFVLNTQDTSIIQNCNFYGLSNPGTKGWSVTGAVNFYEANVRMAHCSFSNNRCEDALNILRSHFEIRNTVFTDIKSDAFDGDFAEGTLRECIFLDIGNDAIDVSGSKLEIDKCIVKNAGDKGISAGENSEITAANVTVINSEVAIASKDKSVFFITNSKFENNRLCFTAFQKKPEFGPADIAANGIEFLNCQLEHLIENGSSLKLNGKSVETVKEVKGKMYGVEFGKSSKERVKNN